MATPTQNISCVKDFEDPNIRYILQVKIDELEKKTGFIVGNSIKFQVKKMDGNSSVILDCALKYPSSSEFAQICYDPKTRLFENLDGVSQFIQLFASATYDATKKTLTLSMRNARYTINN